MNAFKTLTQFSELVIALTSTFKKLDYYSFFKENEAIALLKL